MIVVREDSLPSIEVNQLRYRQQWSELVAGNVPASRFQLKALPYHLADERDFSAWSNHLNVCTSAHLPCFASAKGKMEA